MLLKKSTNGENEHVLLGLIYAVVDSHIHNHEALTHAEGYCCNRILREIGVDAAVNVDLVQIGQVSTIVDEHKCSLSADLLFNISMNQIKLSWSIY